MSYYNTHAQQYADRTFTIDLSHIYKTVLPYIPPNSNILDVGCGSGRDGLYFHDLGHMVLGIDNSEEMVRVATERTNRQFPIIKKDILDLIDIPQLQYNLIWCCASMVTIPTNYILNIVKWMVDGLKVGGVLYMSFKQGETHQFCDGMLHTHVTVDFVLDTFKSVYNASILEVWIDRVPTTDWINVVVRRICI